MSLNVWTANLDQFQRNDAAYLHHLARKADVLLLQECIRADGTPVPVADYLGHGWRVLQQPSSDQAGSVVAWKTPIRRRWTNIVLGFLPYVAGRRVSMRARWATVAGLKADHRFRGVSAHYAPKWADTDGSLHRQMTDALRTIRNRRHAAPLVIGLDANSDIKALARELRMQAFAVGIVGLLIDHRYTIGARYIDRWGIRHNATDHPAIGVTLTRKAKR